MACSYKHISISEQLRLPILVNRGVFVVGMAKSQAMLNVFLRAHDPLIDDQCYVAYL